ncbi:MAG: hypothetical protein JRH13_12405 [Deltaproteobacteria bacterium]|nr:hypothetical protein [Deltaproteobacteria bacterium]MBW2015897.1 hypothetical protein [Deltaproteobacteria bacterium]MBW2130153.1 hypothetical protein [Deltaproteobacteria bacterium]MBW2303606.1 hypothetical protein [Deltaproteobacteria bacterium]
MKAYILMSDGKLEPFDDHPRECLIVNRPLASLQQEAMEKVDLSPVPVADLALIDDRDEYIVFDDYLYFTPELLLEFISRSRPLRCRTVAAFKRGITTLRTISATQSVEECEDLVKYRLWYVPSEDKRGEDTRAVIIMGVQCTRRWHGCHQPCLLRLGREILHHGQRIL